jgi:1,4-dihydroxy-2-naphthoate octaprenyltransferase
MISHWLLAARIKTLPVSLCPVVLGLILAWEHPRFNGLVSVVLIACVLFIQISTNFANDYYDFLKGADTTHRVGPNRMTQMGLIKPITMRNASFITAGLALACGVFLVTVGGWPIFVVGLFALIFVFLYTAGPFALAYIGGAEMIVFLFFGPVSVVGTFYLQTGVFNRDLFLIGIALGLISSALLVVNNTRDIDADRAANKKTFAVRFGRLFSTLEFIICIYAPVIILDYLTQDSTEQMVLVLLLVIIAMVLTRRFNRAQGKEFNRLLLGTSGYLILFTMISIYLLKYTNALSIKM